MKKRLTLEELDLQFPKIELQETHFLLGGTGYDVDIPQKYEIEDPQEPRPPAQPVNELEPGDVEPFDPEIGEQEDYDPRHSDQQDGQDQGDHDEYNDNEYPDQEDYGDQEHEDQPEPEQPPGGGGIYNGSNGSQPQIPNSWTNGVDVQDYPLNSTTAINPQFQNQFEQIIGSNSVVSDLLNQIAQYGGHVNFRVADIADTPGNILAQTLPDQNTLGSQNFQINITFDSTDIGNNGWNIVNAQNGTQSQMAYNTAIESLADTIIHELLHSLYFLILSQAMGLFVEPNVNVPSADVRDYLIQTQGEAFADIFFDVVNGVVQYDPDNEKVEQHDYMFQHDSQIIQAGVTEFQQDWSAYQNYLQDSEAHLGGDSSTDPNGDGRD